MRRSRTIAVSIATLLSQLVVAQDLHRHFSKEVSLISDNDNYLVQKRDGYYTNGFFLSLQHVATKNKHPQEKVIMRYELGQLIFNPYKYSITDPEKMDRPFAGYLFVKANRSRFFQNGSNLQYNLSVGVLGKASGAEQTQRIYHNIINIYPVEGWGYQLKNELGLNLGAQYTYPLSGELRSQQFIDLHAIGRGSLGNTFTNAVAGLMLRIGVLEKAEQSVAWNSRLHNSDPDYFHTHELFAFYQPEGMLQLYNATLQGGAFLKDKGPVTADIEPWLYQHRVGIMYAARRTSAVLAIVHRTKEARHMRRAENYGSIQLSYRFKS